MTVQRRQRLTLIAAIAWLTWPMFGRSWLERAA